MEDLKLCLKCNKYFPATTEFFRTYKVTGNLCSPCFECIRKYNREYKKKQRESVNSEKLIETISSVKIDSLEILNPRYWTFIQ